MNASAIGRGERQLAAANEELRQAVLAIVGAGTAARMLSILIESPWEDSRLKRVGQVLGVNTNTLAATWFRRGLGRSVSFLAPVRLYQLRRVLEVDGISGSDAALVLGSSSAQAMRRYVRERTGQTTSAWHRTTEAAQCLAAWRATLERHRPGLQALRLPATSSREELAEASGALRSAIQRTEQRLGELRAALAATERARAVAA